VSGRKREKILSCKKAFTARKGGEGGRGNGANECPEVIQDTRKTLNKEKGDKEVGLPLQAVSPRDQPRGEIVAGGCGKIVHYRRERDSGKLLHTLEKVRRFHSSGVQGVGKALHYEMAPALEGGNGLRGRKDFTLPNMMRKIDP